MCARQHLPSTGSLGISAPSLSSIRVASVGVTSSGSPGILPVTSISAASSLLLEVRIGFELQLGEGFALRLVRLEEVWDLLVRFEKSAGENRRNGLIALRIEGCGESAVSNATSATCDC
jgi:hypothetical protein